MGLPWRFISASAGMVTLVMGAPVEEDPPPGKLVRLIESPVPLRELRMRPVRGEYTPLHDRCNQTHPRFWTVGNSSAQRYTFRMHFIYVRNVFPLVVRMCLMAMVLA